MKARLSATEIEAYLDGFVNRHASELLPLHNMADVHKLVLVDDFLAPLGLERREITNL